MLVDENRHKVVDELIYYKNRIFLVSGSKIKLRILKAFHNIPLAGHQGYFKTYKKIREWFA